MHRASHHALLQQLTALLLIPLSLWLALFLVRHAGSQGEVLEALSGSGNRLALWLFVAVAAFHAALGIDSILDDYVPGEGLKRALRIGSRTGLALVVAIALLALVSL